MLSAAERDQYARNGYLLVDPVLGAQEIERVVNAAKAAAATHPEATISNAGDGSVRLVYAVHEQDSFCRRLIRLPALVRRAAELLGGDVYVHQSKVTLNTPFTGEGWPWHRDYAFWRTRDRLPRPDVLSAAVLLDDMSVVNGPLMLARGSHLVPMDGEDNLVLTTDRVAELCSRDELVAVQAKAGSVVFFDGRIVHGSSPNVTPFARRVLYITYNRSDNAPEPGADTPPAYTCATDTTPLEPLEDGAALLAV